MSNGPDFRDIIIAWAPYYLFGQWGGRFLESIGSVMNSLGERVDEGRRAVLPQVCQEDALDLHAKDRRIDIYTGEAMASKRVRVARAWQIHRRDGTHLGQMANAQPYFLPGALPKFRIVHQSSDGLRAHWWTRNPDGTVERYVKTPSNWDWDSLSPTPLPPTQAWARSWCLIYTAGTVLDGATAKYGDGSVYGQSGLVYGGLAAQVKRDLIALIKSKRSAHEQLWGVALVRDPTFLDPTGSVATLPDGTTTYPEGHWLRVTQAGHRYRRNGVTWIYDRTRDGA